MNFGHIMQIVGALPTIINTVEQIKGGGNGAIKKEDVKRAVLSSTSTLEMIHKLNVTDRKKFEKELDKVIDGIVGMLKYSTWNK